MFYVFKNIFCVKMHMLEKFVIRNQKHMSEIPDLLRKIFLNNVHCLHFEMIFMHQVPCGDKSHCGNAIYPFSATRILLCIMQNYLNSKNKRKRKFRKFVNQIVSFSAVDIYI